MIPAFLDRVNSHLHVVYPFSKTPSPEEATTGDPRSCWPELSSHPRRPERFEIPARDDKWYVPDRSTHNIWVDHTSLRNTQIVPCRVIASPRPPIGSPVSNALQAIQLPKRNSRHDLARTKRWSAFLCPSWHEVFILCVRHAS